MSDERTTDDIDQLVEELEHQCAQPIGSVELGRAAMAFFRPCELLKEIGHVEAR